MTPDEFMAGAEVTPLGADWGPTPLWRFDNKQAELSVDVAGADEDAARAAALAALPGLLEARP